MGPSCSRHNPWPVDPDPRGAGRLGLSRASSGRGRSQTVTTGTLRRWRAGSGGGEPVREEPGSTVRTTDSLLRGPVSTALTLTSLASKRPAGIVEILRFFFSVPHRYAFNVSTMDTRSSSQTAPHRSRPHRLQGPSPPHRPRTLEEAARPRRPPCAPRVRGGSGPDGAPASLGVPATHQARR